MAYSNSPDSNAMVATRPAASPAVVMPYSVKPQLIAGAAAAAV